MFFVIFSASHPLVVSSPSFTVFFDQFRYFLPFLFLTISPSAPYCDSWQNWLSLKDPIRNLGHTNLVDDTCTSFSLIFNFNCFGWAVSKEIEESVPLCRYFFPATLYLKYRNIFMRCWFLLLVDRGRGRDGAPWGSGEEDSAQSPSSTPVAC